MTDDFRTHPSRSPDTRPVGNDTPNTGDPARRPFRDKTEEKDVETQDAGEGHKGPAGETPKGTANDRPTVKHSNAPYPQSPRGQQTNIQYSGEDSEGQTARKPSADSSV